VSSVQAVNLIRPNGQTFVAIAAHLSGKAQVDGASIRNLDLFRFTSPVFVLTVLPDNPFQTTPGPYFPPVDEGFYVMLKPLPVGEHTLRIQGEARRFALVLDVTYHLTLIPLPLQ